MYRIFCVLVFLYIETFTNEKRQGNVKLYSEVPVAHSDSRCGQQPGLSVTGLM